MNCSYYSSHLGVPTTLHSYEDLRLLNMAERMGLPYATGIVEFDWLKSRTKFVCMSVSQFVCPYYGNCGCMVVTTTFLMYVHTGAEVTTHFMVEHSHVSMVM